MKALVTGGAGFVGSTLSERLLSDGWVVASVDSLTDYYDTDIKRRNLASVMSHNNATNFAFIQADLNSANLHELLSDVDVVFHQAGQPGVRKSWGADFDHYLSANIQATQRLLEAARESSRLKRLVYASSSSVYGDAETYPTSEFAVPQPRSPYGVTKLAAEHLCSLYAANYGVPTVSLRYFTVYGPRQRPDMAFTRFLSAALAEGEITLYGDGEQIRDFTYIDDVVEANVLAALRDVAPGTVLNVCGGSSVSVNDVLREIGRITGTAPKVRRYPAVAGDVRQTGGDSSHARKLLGWKPTRTVEEGLREQYRWLANAVQPSI